jgi:hypothetical protein
VFLSNLTRKDWMLETRMESGPQHGMACKPYWDCLSGQSPEGKYGEGLRVDCDSCRNARSETPSPSRGRRGWGWVIRTATIAQG